MAADASEVHELAADLRKAGVVAAAAVVPVVKRGANNIKTDWRRGWTGIRHAPRLPQAITYDVVTSRDGVEATIGPDSAIGQGFLGRVIHDGGARNAPRPSGHAALATEAPKFVAALTVLVVPKL